MSLLVLGGTGDAKWLAEQLTSSGHRVIYSLAGLTARPVMPCEVITGGFSQGAVQDGATGLACFVERRVVRLIIDATHPYAAQISANAERAATATRTPCWRLHRPAWPDALKGKHTLFDDVPQLIPMLQNLTRPFFTVGQTVLTHANLRPGHQHWIVRTAVPVTAGEGISTLCQRGPFSLSDERLVMREHRVDALVTKDSGGTSVAAKLQAAHEQALPVFIQRRPDRGTVDKEFSDGPSLLAAVRVAFPANGDLQR